MKTKSITIRIEENLLNKLEDFVEDLNKKNQKYKGVSWAMKTKSSVIHSAIEEFLNKKSDNK